MLSIVAIILAATSQAATTPPQKAPDTPAPASDRIKAVKFDIAKANQPIPFAYIRGLILIPAEVAGQRGWMLIDTGASQTIIDSGLAKELGLPIIPLKGHVVGTGGHLIPRQKVDDVPLVIPRHFSVRMPMLAIDLEPVSRAFGRRIVGVIGENLISSMPLMVNKPKGWLVLMPGGKFSLNCEGPCADKLPIPLKRERTPLGEKLQLTASVNGHGLKLTLDTGSTEGISLTPAAWERIKPADAQVFTGSHTGASGIAEKVLRSRLPKVSFGPVDVEDVDVTVQGWDASAGDGIVGMGVLSRYSFTVDVQAGQLWLFPAPADISKLTPPVLSTP